LFPKDLIEFGNNTAFIAGGQNYNLAGSNFMLGYRTPWALTSASVGRGFWARNL
jgi:hypothetical protein